MNTNISLVSIIIPVYNHEKYVQETLSSIVNDSYPSKEIVIIDDGSTDKTNNVIEEWIQKHKEIVVQYKSRENKGVSTTLNELVNMAQGEYICIVASDDYLLDGGIAKRVEYLQQNISKMAVFGDCIGVSNDNTIMHDSILKDYYQADIKKYKNENLLRNEIIMNWSVPGPVFLARKDLYVRYGMHYNENLIGEDWDMYLKLVAKDYLGFVDFKVSAYRIHDNNTCVVLGKKILLDRIKTILHNIHHFKFKDKFKMMYILNKLVIVYIIKYFINIIEKIMDKY